MTEGTMTNQVEFPNFAGERAAGINDRLEDYAKAQKAIEQAEASKKAEINRIKSEYDYQIDKAKNVQARLKAELQGFINVDEGETSLTTSLGNIHLVKNQNKIIWPKGASKTKLILEELPKEFIKYTPSINKAALNKSTIITDDGKVVIEDTGQVLEGVSGELGKGQSLTVTLGKALKPAKNKEASKK